jgi:chaperonin GroES
VQRLISKVVREVARGERFESYADLNDELRRRLNRLRIRYEQRDFDEAIGVVAANTNLITPPTRMHAVSPEPLPLSRDEAGALLKQLRVSVCQMPKGRLIPETRAAMLKAARLVAQEIVECVARCEALESQPQPENRPMGKIYDHLELIGARLIVRPLPDLDLTQGGIVLPDTGRHTQNRAIVEKVGPGELVDGPVPTREGDRIAVARKPMTVAVGDLVLYQKYAGTWVILDELERLMLLEDEVQGRVPAAKFTLITHDDSEHLEGEPCLICSAPKEQAAKANLAALRQELVAESSPSES